MNRTELYGVQAGGDPPALGWRAAGGDFDGDGYADLALAEPGVDLVLVYAGSASGMQSTAREVSAQTFNPGPEGLYGPSLAVGDTDADGYDDLGVGVWDVPGELAVYFGGPGGLTLDSEVVLARPPDGGDLSASGFAQEAAGGGDMNGDGYADILVSDPTWGKTNGTAGDAEGALFVYEGGPDGPDPCPHLIPNRIPDDDGSSRPFGDLGAGDLNGDGYSDVAAACFTCAGDQSPYVFALGSADWNVELQTGPLDAFMVAVAGDLDADGFVDLAITNWGYPTNPGTDDATVIVYGSPSGPDPDATATIASGSLHMGRVGDVDADGYEDLALVLDEGVQLVFGASARLEDPPALWLPVPETERGFTVATTVVGGFDMNGDGRSELVTGDGDYWDNKGRLFVDSPTCLWYADTDADGHGDPAVTQTTCHDPGTGWIAVPDDCDDSDPARSGSVWFPDADGDGYGTGQGVLACEQPANTATENHDCDDADAGVSPGAEDSTADGLDQDCDGHDGPWAFDTGGDCPDLYDTDTADTADTGALDTADTATLDTADTSPADDDTGHGSPRDPGCGCNTPASPGRPAAAALLALVAACATRRRA